MSQKSKVYLWGLERIWQRDHPRFFSSHLLHQSLRVFGSPGFEFWDFFPNQNDLAVSISKEIVIKSDIINYLVHSSNAVDELDHKAEVYTMSTELLIYINFKQITTLNVRAQTYCDIQYIEVFIVRLVCKDLQEGSTQ